MEFKIQDPHRSAEDPIGILVLLLANFGPRPRAPSNHAEMSLRLSIENGDACRLRFFAEGAQGVPSTTSGESYAVDIEAGEAGCGAGTAPNKCNTGVAIVVLDPDALDSQRFATCNVIMVQFLHCTIINRNPYSERFPYRTCFSRFDLAVAQKSAFSRPAQPTEKCRKIDCFRFVFVFLRRQKPIPPCRPI